jgi:four helix bundle protein
MDRYDFKRRTKLFAHDCVKFTSSLPNNKLGNHIEGQLIRSATSVAVNYRAVLLAQSDAAFSAKLSIVIEEVDECDFWVEFALDEQIASSEIATSMRQRNSQQYSLLPEKLFNRKTKNNRNAMDENPLINNN